MWDNDISCNHPQSFALSAFAQRNAGMSGNPCSVDIYPSEADSTGTAPDAHQINAGQTVTCSSWPVAERLAAVKCRTPQGHDIECCGHGMLCCAEYWLDRWHEGGALRYGTSDVPCLRDGDNVWLSLPAAAPQACKVPSWLESAMPNLPGAVARCAEAGGDRGYLVIELAPGTDLAAAVPPRASLADYSQRAIILTCRAANQRLVDEDIHLRYFAPQYGVDEDSATGSALRILAGHYTDVAGPLRAVQRSTAGGYLMACRENDRVWVGGKVENTRMEDSRHA